jgi:hypothetical protein
VAQKIQTLIIDDLDGSDAEGTVRFALDGAEYEIDLNAGHAKELRDALARYVGAARRVGSSAQWSCLKAWCDNVTVLWLMMVLRVCRRTAGCRTGSRSGC